MIPAQGELLGVGNLCCVGLDDLTRHKRHQRFFTTALGDRDYTERIAVRTVIGRKVVIVDEFFGVEKLRRENRLLIEVAAEHPLDAATAALSCATTFCEYPTATANTNLAALLNAPTTTTAQGVSIGTTAAGYLFYGLGWTATGNATNTTIVAPGQGFLQVSTNLTASSTDGFIAAKQVQHWLFGIKGAIDAVVQARPTTEIKDVPDKIGKNILPWILYGKKTFTEGKAKLVDVQVRTDAFVL